MTAQEMKYDFLFKRDQTESLKGKTFLDNEIDWFLNTAQLSLVKAKILGRTPDSQGIEENQKRIDDISAIVVAYPAQPALTLDYHSDDHIYELKLDTLKFTYLYFINGRVEVVNCRDKANIKLIQHDDKYTALKDPFNKSNNKEILANFGSSSSGNGTSLYLYPEIGTTLGKIFFDYVRIPRKINQGSYTYLDGNIYPSTSSELSEAVHPEIVDLATQQASMVTGEQTAAQGANYRLQLSN